MAQGKGYEELLAHDQQITQVFSFRLMLLLVDRTSFGGCEPLIRIFLNSIFLIYLPQSSVEFQKLGTLVGLHERLRSDHVALKELYESMKTEQTRVKDQLSQASPRVLHESTSCSEKIWFAPIIQFQ